MNTYVFTSPCGGVGKSVMAAACAKAHALLGKNVIYVNCDELEKARDYITEDCNAEISDAGVRIWDTMDDQESGKYDEMIVNMPFPKSKDELVMFEKADEIIMISTATEASNEKMTRGLATLEEELYDGRLCLLYNMFDNDASVMLENFPARIIGGAPVVQSHDTKEIIDKMAAMNFFNILLDITAEKERKAKEALMYGETTVLSENMLQDTPSEAGETTILMRPYLVRKKNEEKIPINKSHFIIGKEQSAVDYFVSDNPAVSRNHADIMTENTECYIVDKDSTNHTYVNGMMIAENTPVRLRNGAQIRLGNEEFEFWEECV